MNKGEVEIEREKMRERTRGERNNREERIEERETFYKECFTSILSTKMWEFVDLTCMEFEMVDMQGDKNKSMV